MCMSMHEFLCAVCIGVCLFMAAVMAFYDMFAKDGFCFIPILRISAYSYFKWRWLMCKKKTYCVFENKKFALLLNIQAWSADIV